MKRFFTQLRGTLKGAKADEIGLTHAFKNAVQGFMGLGAGFSPRKVGLQGASSLSLSLSLV